MLNYIKQSFLKTLWLHLNLIKENWNLMLMDKCKISMNVIDNNNFQVFKI